ncbi:MAG: tRNA (adenosine(37)-N6)-threonylcarbamoyltransferase complex ATPase subunit type 1 TsaE [Planctomycetota bacterium]
MNPAITWQSKSPAATLKLGRMLGDMARPGDLFALSGPLGAGKTQLVKGLAEGLEVAADELVVSPTFVLVREYAGRLTLYHIDLYRLKAGSELWSLGLDEMLDDPQSVIAIEWADRAAEILPPESWQIELAHAGSHKRQITIIVPDPQRMAILRQRLS